MNGNLASRSGEGARAITLRGAPRVEWDGITSAPVAIHRGRVAEPVSNAFAIDLRDHLIVPGLVNAHDHLQLNCLPRLVGDRRFENSYEWMADAQKSLATEAFDLARRIPAATRMWQGAIKNAVSGATTVGHHDDPGGVGSRPEFPVRLPPAATWCHSLGLGTDDPGATGLRYGPEVVASHGATPASGRWFVHLAEGCDAVAAAELDRLEALGCLTGRTVIVHGVALDPMQTERVLARGASLVWCPGSNLAMFGRTISPRRPLEARRLALGTDSRLTGSKDLLDELRVAAGASDLTPSELLRLVTVDGAAVLGVPDVGRLAPGCRADLLVVRDESRDPQAAILALGRADLRAVIRGGVPLVTDPDLAEWFAATSVEAVPVELDGRPKLCARTMLGPCGAAELERGLRV